MMREIEVGELARALITTANDIRGVSEILAGLPEPFPDGAQLIATLAFVAAHVMDLAADRFGQTPDEFRIEYFAAWAARSHGIAPDVDT